jgi:hypothetical protein
VLLVYEQHQIVGQHEAAFENAYRGEWAPLLAESADARLLWYFNVAHGAGRSYQIITLTGLVSGRTWQSLRDRLTTGDLSSWLRAVQSYRYRVVSKVLVPEPDSPLDLELSSIPGERDEGDPGLYVEEIVRAGENSSDRPTTSSRVSSFSGFELSASFRPAFGTGTTPESTRLYRIRDLGLLVEIMTGEPRRGQPDSAQSVRSRLLRTAAWSPLL